MILNASRSFPQEQTGFQREKTQHTGPSQASVDAMSVSISLAKATPLAKPQDWGGGHSKITGSRVKGVKLGPSATKSRWELKPSNMLKMVGKIDPEKPANVG